MIQLIKTYKKERKYYNSIWEMIYVSEWFNPIYRLYKLPSRLYSYIEKFIYYGKVGTRCYDFDAGSVHALINAHIKRVEAFMHSDDTHLVWNSDSTSKNMKRLREFSELCSRMERNEFNDYYYTNIEVEKYGRLFDNLIEAEDGFLVRERSSKEAEAFRKAYKKDSLRAEHLRKRYYYMFEKYVGGFWD